MNRPFEWIDYIEKDAGFFGDMYNSVKGVVHNIGNSDFVTKGRDYVNGVSNNFNQARQVMRTEQGGGSVAQAAAPSTAPVPAIRSGNGPDPYRNPTSYSTPSTPSSNPSRSVRRGIEETPYAGMSSSNNGSNSGSQGNAGSAIRTNNPPTPPRQDSFQRNVQKPLNTQQQQGLNWFAKGNSGPATGKSVMNPNNNSTGPMGNPNSLLNQARARAQNNGYNYQAHSAINKARAAYKPVGVK